ncbi:hypothetical protein [Nocardia tengchongensis]|uniref:hypothetical protein n=1 Tax=Nocardia tengchongensis TaxID=2055889 RepID=UPI003657979F
MSVMWPSGAATAVDKARLLFADVAALNSWRNDDPIDGLFDIAFWGRDADVLADRMVSAPASVDGEFTWADLTLDELRARYGELESLRAEGLRFAVDVRPHDDHFRVLGQMRGSATESGLIDVGGARMTGWFTSWGDGAFPVFRDVAADGTLLRVRVQFGAPLMSK